MTDSGGPFDEYDARRWRDYRRLDNWMEVIVTVWMVLALATIVFAEVGLASIGAAEWGGYAWFFALVLAGFTAHVYRELRDHKRYFEDTATPDTGAME